MGGPGNGAPRTDGTGDPAQAITVQGVTVQFGGVTALKDVDLSLRIEEIHGLIGPNGAGKSTLVNVMAGANRRHEGTITFGGENVDGLRVDQRARRGLSRTFQAPALFSTLTIRENLDIAQQFRTRCGRELTDDQLSWLDDVQQKLGLHEWLDTPVGHCPYPVQKTTDTLRALYTRPTVLLVDEPAAGLPRHDREILRSLLTEARSRLNTSVLIIEHDVPLVFDLCDRLTVLNFGQVIAAGTPEEVRRDPEVREAYLGSLT